MSIKLNESELRIANDLRLTTDNDGYLYLDMVKGYRASLLKKYEKGIFDVDRAAKGFEAIVDESARRYVNNFPDDGPSEWYKRFPKRVRQSVAREMAEFARTELELGAF